MEFCENPEPGYNNYEIRRQGILCGEPAALESNLTVAGTDVDGGIRNNKLHVASAAKRDLEVEEEEEEEEDRGRKRRMSNRICCGVCLEELRVGECVARLPCTDLFHQRCIVAWLRLIQYDCPVCQMPVADHEDDDDDEMDHLSDDGYCRDNCCPYAPFKEIELGCLK